MGGVKIISVLNLSCLWTWRKAFETHFLNSTFETLHVCYRCAEKEYAPFQTGKISFDKIIVLPNLSPDNQCPRNKFAA